MTHRYYLSVGCNLEPREFRIEEAVGFLSSLPGSMICSTPYATAPIGHDAGNERRHYPNAVAFLETELSAFDLDTCLKNYEKECGRTQAARLHHDVPIDIDIVIADDNVVRPKDFERYYFRQGYEELKY